MTKLSQICVASSLSSFFFCSDDDDDVSALPCYSMKSFLCLSSVLMKSLIILRYTNIHPLQSCYHKFNL